MLALFFFFFFFHLTCSRWTSSLPSCLWSQRIFPSLPGSRLTFFLSRCKFSTLTTRQPMVEFLGDGKRGRRAHGVLSLFPSPHGTHNALSRGITFLTSMLWAFLVYLLCYFIFIFSVKSSLLSHDDAGGKPHIYIHTRMPLPRLIRRYHLSPRGRTNASYIEWLGCPRPDCAVMCNSKKHTLTIRCSGIQ